MKFWLRISSVDTLVGGAVVSSLYGKAESDKAAEEAWAKLQVTWTLSWNQKWAGEDWYLWSHMLPVCFWKMPLLAA